MKNLTAFLLCFWVFQSNASQTFECTEAVTGWHIATRHTDRTTNYQENNAGMYFKCKNGFTAGHYNNSDWKQSDYIGYSFEYKNLQVTVAMISGYKIEPIPAVIPSLLIPGTAIRVAYLPQAPNNTNNTTGWHVMLEANFN